MYKNLLVWLTLTTSLLISGCAQAPLKVQTVATEKTPLALADPAPLRINGPLWIVVTPDNLAEVWADLKKNNVDLVLFALTDNGYEKLSIDYAEIRNLISEQRQIILKYKEYYEPSTREKAKAVEAEKPLGFWERLFGKTQ